MATIANAHTHTHTKHANIMSKSLSSCWTLLAWAVLSRQFCCGFLYLLFVVTGGGPTFSIQLLKPWFKMILNPWFNDDVFSAERVPIAQESGNRRWSMSCWTILKDVASIWDPTLSTNGTSKPNFRGTHCYGHPDIDFYPVKTAFSQCSSCTLTRTFTLSVWCETTALAIPQ